MQLNTEELSENVTKVILNGSLDLAGAEEIGLKMSVLAGSRKSLLVDLEALSFLSSMGIRTLLTAAKTILRRGGKLILLKPNPTVHKVLLTTGCDALMPITQELDEALRLLAA